jgi:sugar/nucleoside kinase (ribokinase family)
MARIHCLGVLVVDALSGPLPHYPTPRVETQVVTKFVRFQAGGGAANTSAALGKMRLEVGVFSKTGNDTNGQFLLAELRRAGVDTMGIRQSDNESTPFTFVGIHPDGDRSFIHTPGSNLTFDRNDLDRERLFDTQFLLYQDCWVLPRLDGEPGAALLAEARRRGIVTLLDECWGLGPKRDVFETMAAHCDYVLPSLDDMRVIYPGLAPEAIADRLLALGARAVVLKMGAEGCLVTLSDRRVPVSACPAKVVDSTGAGDCWNAGFIAGLAHGVDPIGAAGIGNACAAFCIEAVGGATGIPVYEEVVRRAGSLRL